MRGEVELYMRANGREMQRRWSFEMLRIHADGARLSMLADDGFEQISRALRPPPARSSRR